MLGTASGTTETNSSADRPGTRVRITSQQAAAVKKTRIVALPAATMPVVSSDSMTRDPGAASVK